MTNPGSGWGRFITSNMLGPALTTVRVDQYVLTLHQSLVREVVFWVLAAPAGAELGGLHAEWQARRLGGRDVVFGRLPLGASGVIARDSDSDRHVEVHHAHGVYALEIAEAHDLELIFEDSAKRAMRRVSIPSRLRPNLGRGPQDRSHWVRHAKLSAPLVTIQAGGVEVTVHRQDGTGLRRPILKGVLDHPAGTLWAVEQSAWGGGVAQPLRRDCETEDPANPGWVQFGNPSADRLEEAVKVWCGTLPQGTRSVEATVDGQPWEHASAVPSLFWADPSVGNLPAVDIGGIFVTSEVFYVIVPFFDKDVVVTARDEVNEVLARQDLPACQQM